MNSGTGSAIEAVVIATKKGPFAVRGRVFVDATGDADVVFHAGASWEMGEPGRLQYPSMQFYMENGDVQEAMAAGLGSKTFMSPSSSPLPTIF